MCPSLVEISSVTSEIKRRNKRKRKTTAVKYKPFGIAMPCGIGMQNRKQNIGIAMPAGRTNKWWE